MYTGNEKVWPFSSRRCRRRAGTRCRCRASRRRAHGRSSCWSNAPTSLGVQIRYETGATKLILDADGAVVGVAWKQFTETGAVRAKSVIIAAGGFAMNPEMVAEHTPALGQPRRTSTMALRPTSWATPTTTGWACGWASRPAASPSTWTKSLHHRGGVSAVEILLTGIIVNKLGQALRRRGLLSLAHFGIRHGSAGTAPHI